MEEKKNSKKKEKTIIEKIREYHREHGLIGRFLYKIIDETDLKKQEEHLKTMTTYRPDSHEYKILDDYHGTSTIIHYDLTR